MNPGVASIARLEDGHRRHGLIPGPRKLKTIATPSPVRQLPQSDPGRIAGSLRRMIDDAFRVTDGLHLEFRTMACRADCKERDRQRKGQDKIPHTYCLSSRGGRPRKAGCTRASALPAYSGRGRKSSTIGGGEAAADGGRRADGCLSEKQRHLRLAAVGTMARILLQAAGLTESDTLSRSRCAVGRPDQPCTGLRRH